MFKDSIAKRYSAALFGIAKDRGEVAPVTAQLDSFVAALKSDNDLYAFYTSPVVDRRVKERILIDVLHDRASELLVNFVILLIRKRRENLIEFVARQMHEMLDEEAGREPATVGAPMPLDAANISELAQRLSRVYRRNIIPQTKISPDLLGGLVVQVGDRYVDASVSYKLEELRRHLLATADTWGGVSPNGKGST